MSEIKHHSIRIAAIVPFPEGNGDEVLMLPTSDGVTLPVGDLRYGEHLLQGASRIVRNQVGLSPIAERVLYVLEERGSILTVGVLCSLSFDQDDTVDLKGEFVSLARYERTLEPTALREILLEDVRSGFVRPVAHIVESSGEDGVSIQISW
ncbi:MAG TPA: hypothetical protein VHG52_12395 [Thermomicrobiales bacterium]|nr:hypothetical protein [Thermomicrobiales bacterium]